MWFRNLRIYRLIGELPCAGAELGEHLGEAAFVPCASMDTRRVGWVPPLGATAVALTHSVNDFHLVCMRTQQKLLPAAAIREVLDEQILQREAAEGRKLHKRERVNLKDEVIQTLLPRALTRSQLTFAFLAAARGLLLVDSPTPARAEDLLSLLRDSLGRLPIRPLVPRHNPVELMTRWLAGNRLPAGLRLGQYCDLRDPLNAANVVRCRQQDLATREVREHLEAGKQVGALGLQWKERLGLVLTEDLAVRQITYPEIVRNDSGIDPELDATARFDADFALMSLELDQLAADLIEIFGIADD